MSSLFRARPKAPTTYIPRSEEPAFNPADKAVSAKGKVPEILRGLAGSPVVPTQRNPRLNDKSKCRKCVDRQVNRQERLSGNVLNRKFRWVLDAGCRNLPLRTYTFPRY